MNLDLSSIGLAAIRKVTDLWRGAKADSLIDYTQVVRVEPLVLIDADCLFLESLPEVQQSLLNIFAGYYLQAVAISNTVGKVEVFRQLDKLNPNRNPVDSGADSAGWLLAQESYKHRLPTPGNKHMALEADEDQASAFALGRDTNQTMKELANLSVGKILNVEITDGLHRATLPISIRLMASSMPSANLVHILSIGNQDNSVKERYHAWKAGRLSFVRDLIFCQDLIDAHRKNLMADKDGLYSSILKRNRGNQIATLVSGNPSVATASNIAIMSIQSAEALEMKVNGRLKDFKTREAIFKATSLMILAVIDPSYDRVVFYHRGINGHTDVSVRDLKAGNKGNGGPDVSEILKAYQVGHSPSL